jgi:hypothetical protein
MYFEYLLLTFPFAASSLLTENWFCYPLLVALLFVVPYLKFTIAKKTYLKNLTAYISASDFEWVSGFRKSFWIIIPIYLLALGMSWFRILPLIFLWFITITVSSFYTEFEPLHILKEGNHSPAGLIKRKIRRMLNYILILYLPVLVINTIICKEFWVLNLLFIPMQVSLLSYAVCLKYTSYEPGKNAVGNNVILSIVSLGSIIPYFVPIPMLLALFTYNKATNNLKNYLND